MANWQQISIDLSETTEKSALEIRDQIQFETNAIWEKVWEFFSDKILFVTKLISDNFFYLQKKFFSNKFFFQRKFFVQTIFFPNKIIHFKEIFFLTQNELSEK